MEENRFNIDFKGNRILSNTQIHGKIQTKQSILIDGKVQGNVVSEQCIIINQGAFILGDVVCAELYLNGTITGNAHVTHKTTLGAQAIIEGALITAILTITPGASIQKGLKLQKPTTPKP